MMDRKGQGALEYLLLIGGAVLVAVIVITLLLQITAQGEKDTTATADAAAILLCENRLQLLCGTNLTTPDTYTGDCTPPPAGSGSTSTTTCPP